MILSLSIYYWYCTLFLRGLTCSNRPMNITDSFLIIRTISHSDHWSSVRMNTAADNGFTWELSALAQQFLLPVQLPATVSYQSCQFCNRAYLMRGQRSDKYHVTYMMLLLVVTLSRDEKHRKPAAHKPEVCSTASSWLADISGRYMRQVGVTWLYQISGFFIARLKLVLFFVDFSAIQICLVLYEIERYNGDRANILFSVVYILARSPRCCANIKTKLAYV